MEQKDQNKNIYELIYLSSSMDEDALSHLFMEMKSIAHGVYFDFLLVGKELLMEEWIALAQSVLFECIVRYRSDKSAGFPTYYRQILRNTAMDINRRQSAEGEFRSANPILSTGQIAGPNDMTAAFAVCQDPYDLHAEILVKTRNEFVLEELEKFFTESEMQILKLRMHDYSQREIARQTDFSRYAITKVLQRACKLVSKIDSDES